MPTPVRRRVRARPALSVRYGIDRENRLLITDPVRAIRPRQALEGTWKLTSDSELVFTVREGREQDPDTLFLKGAVAAANGHALAFAVHHSDDGAQASQRVTLTGRWAADAANRLTFLVQKSDGSEDRLTLQGGWEVGPHQEILYRYRPGAAPGSRDERTMVFAGAWEIAGANRLVYRLTGSGRSAFEFKASVQSRSLLAREGRMAYQIGIGLEQGRRRQQRVTLFGTWKLNRDLSVSFEVPYAGGRVQAMRFEGAYALSARNRVAVALQNSRREPLGLTVLFTREVVPDVRLFLRLQQAAQERSVIGGVQVRF